MKDAIEDLKRHMSDNRENHRKCLVANHTHGRFEETLWKNVRVGNIVKIRKDELFPADLLLLNSSLKKGICYVETKNLDGETNLKHKSSIQEITKICKDEKETLSFKGFVFCDKPNDKIY